jgi:hypothetical protein
MRNIFPILILDWGTGLENEISHSTLLKKLEVRCNIKIDEDLILDQRGVENIEILVRNIG